MASKLTETKKKKSREKNKTATSKSAREGRQHIRVQTSP